MTVGKMDAFEFCKNRLIMDDYSAVLISGGDGTIHEVINGLV